MVQGLGLYIEHTARKAETETLAVSGREEGFKHTSEIILERFLESDVQAVKPLSISSLQLQPPQVFAEYFVRAFDFIGSAVLLLLASPFMLLIPLLIKLSSAGPVFYKQRRVGEFGKFFTLYKFRTMVDNAEKHTGPVLAVRDDDRVTPIGKLLRRTRLDELPQLFNVLKGDMSLVGPRPERPFFVKKHKSLQGIRLAVKPGITGLAQIRGLYDLKPEHKLKYDYLYIKKRSFMLNLYILLQTIPIIFLKRGW